MEKPELMYFLLQGICELGSRKKAECATSGWTHFDSECLVGSTFTCSCHLTSSGCLAPLMAQVFVMTLFSPLGWLVLLT